MTELSRFKNAPTAPYAMREEDSAGRARPEAEHPFRGPFQRDRDRIIHCSAFRRLEKKTQVFVAYEGDYYRTRLTHTIEVSQISRTMARALGVNEDLAEAVALAHDLGHPPFGHAGEKALHELMEGRGGFEHNCQSLRVVDLLESRYPDFPGLNLSCEVREGIIKHTTDYDAPDPACWEGPAGNPTIEAQIVNLADGITYACHDLDDSLKSGICSEEQISQVALCREALESMSHPSLAGSEKMRRYQLVRRLIDIQVTDALAETSARLAASGVKTIADVRSARSSHVGFSAGMESRAAELKEFLMRNFYRDPRVLKMSDTALETVDGLFKIYLNAPSLMPEDALRRDGEDSIHRIICDYVAGMTDGFAMDEYERLRAGS